MNGDMELDVSDAVYLLLHFFKGGPEPVAIAQEPALTPEQEAVLDTMRVQGNTLFIEGVNVQIVNGQGQTEIATGVGNLVVGYNEGAARRMGSHNVIVGSGHTAPSYGGLVVGAENSILGPYCAITGGRANRAEGNGAVVSGGEANVASGDFSSITAGTNNQAVGRYWGVTAA